MRDRLTDTSLCQSNTAGIHVKLATLHLKEDIFGNYNHNIYQALAQVHWA